MNPLPVPLPLPDKPRAPALAFVAFLLAWALLFAYLATLEPTLHDGWWPAADHSHRDATVSGLFDFIRYSYREANPRLGQWLVYAAFQPGPWHALLAAAGACALLIGTFVLAYARWPRPRDLADTARLVAIAGLCFACLPNPGQMFCYRPFTGNYVWGACVTIALVAPYRIALARGVPASRGALAAAGMLVLGLAAGMANEHTGPIALVAVAAATALVRRRDGRAHAWAVAGLVGFAAGFALLVGAPGQSLRYHGLADQSSLVDNLLDRGLGGNLHIVGMGLLYSLGSWTLLAIALVKTRRARGPAAAWRREIAVLAACALAIVATVLLSPKWGPRMFVAPAVLLLAAALRAFDEAFTCRLARAAFAAVGALLAIAGAAQLVRVEQGARDDFDARVAIMRAAPPGSIPAVPPYRRFAPTWWTFGDDFRSAPLRQHVARRLFGLDDVTLDTRDPAVLAGAGVTLSLELDPPDADRARAADPDGDGFSEQIFTPPGFTTAVNAFQTAVARARARGPLTGARLRIRGLDDLAPRPLVLASWDARDARFTLPTADLAPAGSLLVPVVGGGAATPVRVATPVDALLRDARSGAYLLVTCDPELCHVLAARRR